jgi:hypothetical protein
MTRLVRLYARVEQMRSLERRVAAQALDEVVAASSIHTAVQDHATTDIRASFVTGDREQWAIGQAEQRSTARHLESLAGHRKEREAALGSAVDAHRESRLMMERVELIIAKTDAKRALEQDRREQSIADDRFASRAAWTRTKARE